MHTRASPKIVSNITLIYSPKLAEKPPVARPNDDAIKSSTASAVVDRSTAGAPAGQPHHRETSMSKRIALLSAVAFGALALTATIAAPVSAQEKTVMVGGAAMFPSKNIVQNAVNSKDHTRWLPP